MRSFADRLLDIIPEQDDLDFAESDRGDYYPPVEHLTNGQSHMLGYCGRHTMATDPDQELDPDPWEES